MHIRLSVIILLAFFTASSCKQSANKSTVDEKPVTNKTVVAVSPEEEELGPVIFTIDFKVKATGEDKQYYEDGYITFVNIDNPQQDLNNLQDGDKIVLPYTPVQLIIDYPLDRPAEFVLSAVGTGFTKKQLVEEISKRYHRIYKEEETTANTKTTPMEDRKTLANRNTTDGKYGIWGHDITDLVLSSVEVHKSASGKITLTLGIDS